MATQLLVTAKAIASIRIRAHLLADKERDIVLLEPYNEDELYSGGGESSDLVMPSEQVEALESAYELLRSLA